MKIYNTLSKQKETFTPIEEGKVSMYVCGMTVYDYCHLGHARVMVAFDVITRYLREKGYAVNYIRNITDIDDKIINRANENGEPFTQLVDRFVDAMTEDFDKLGITRPTSEPKATAHVDDIITMVQSLIEKGFAYAADNGDVYYSVRKFENYGKLSGKILDELESGARVDVEEHKQDPLDFALWKFAKPDEPHWDSPWGIGRPGWHIECSAMSKCCLGNTFDIHGGGPDLKFPHHENEIAQSEAANGDKYVNTWMHAGAVRVDGEKMSKSLGNFFTIRDILEKYDAEVVRFFLLSSQYRSSINYSEDSLKEAQSKLERFYTALNEVAIDENAAVINNAFSEKFYAAMDDDFNTPEAIAVLFDLTRELNKADADKKSEYGTQLRQLSAVLGILQSDAQSFLQGGGNDDEAAYVLDMIEQRATAKAEKNWGRADEIRDELQGKGIVLKDGPEGTSWIKQ